MSRILCIETSTKVCSVAIGINGEEAATREIHEENYSHAENLNLFIEDAIADAGLNLSDIDAVAVSEGPGSYTGLRIGVATAKGIAFGIDAPLIAVSTLEAMAYGASKQTSGDFYIPMIDARRMEVFSAVYNSNGECCEKTKAVVLDANSYSDYIAKGSCIFFGDGSEKFKSLIDAPNVYFDDCFPSARYMLDLANAKYISKQFVDTAYFEPFYLKDFVAGKPKKVR